ncbi:MAG: hypothetical protein WDN75_11605 [Bacteroidota bacterium]
MIVEIIILNLGVLSGVAWWLSRMQPGSNRWIFWTSLLAKVLAGTAVGILYFYYYRKGDTLIYWRDAVLLADKIMSNPLESIKFFWDEGSTPHLSEGFITWDSRSVFFVKICSVLAILSGSSYWVMAIQMSFISFLGAWYLFTRIIFFFPSSRSAAAISFLFYPSVVFWSSGLIKESLGLGAIFFLAGIFLMIIKNQKLHVWEWLIMLVSLWVGWNLKYYWIGVFVPVVLATIVIVKLGERTLFIKRFDLVSWTALLIIILLIGTNIHPNFSPGRFLEVIVENNRQFMPQGDVDKTSL